MTVMSEYFRFVEWKNLVVSSSEPGGWTPDLARLLKGKPDRAFWEIYDRWVYLFQDQGRGLEWYGEYRVRLNQIDPVDFRGFEQAEPEDRPDPTPGNPRIMVPHTVNGDRAVYYGYSSTIRLSIAAIQQLQSIARDRLPYMDLDVSLHANSSLLDSHQLHQVNGEWVFPCIEPLGIGLSLAAYYQIAATKLIDFSATYDGQSDLIRKDVDARNKTKLLAETLDGILASSPDNALGLENEFAPGGIKKLRNWLAEYQAVQKATIRESDRRGAELCHWLDAPLFLVAQEAHLNNPKLYAGEFLTAYAECVDRLFECSPGKAFVLRTIEDQGHFIHTYVLPASPSSDVVFQVVRKVAAAFASLWVEFSSAYLSVRGTKSAQFLVTTITNITRLDLLVVDLRSGNIRISSATLEVIEVKVEIETIKWKVDVNSKPAKLAEWSTEGHSVRKLADRLLRGIEVLNFGLALKTAIGADPGLSRIMAVIGALGSTADLFSAFAPLLLKKASRTILWVGVGSALADVICAVNDSRAMAKRNDYSAMVGFGVGLGFGAALVGIGSTMTLFGIGSGSTVVGLAPGVATVIAGGILIAAGWVTVLFTSDSDLETFVSHCLWGAHYGEGDAELSWAGGTLASWKGNLNAQLSALFTLLGAFHLESKDRTKVRIWLGMTQPASKFYIEFETTWNGDVVHKPQLSIDVGTQQMTQVSGSPASLGAITFGVSKERRYIDVEGRYPPGQKPAGKDLFQVQLSRCWVYLDLNGDGESLIPRSKTWVLHEISWQGRGLNGSITSSSDF